MATYDYQTTVNINGNYKEKPPKKEGFTTYVRGSVDVTKAGEYLITYTFIKQDPFESITETRLVTVVETFNLDDSPAPEVYLNGDTVVTINEGSSWTDPGAYAIDPEFTNSQLISFIDVKTVLPIPENSWSSQPAGSYSILYYAVSGSNRIGFATRTVVVERVAATIALNGCSKIYIEYPSSGGALSYVGQNYTGSGNITVDAGYSVSGSNYSVQIGVEPEDGEIYIVSEDKVFFTADPAQTKTYKIFYKVTTLEGYERTSIREVVMMKDGETDTTVLSGLEFQKSSADECADREPIVTEEELLKDDLENYGDSVFDDPVLSPTPTDSPDPLTYNSLSLFCAGRTAFSGGLFPSSWSSNPGKIPNEIVESWYSPSSTRTAWDSFFSVVNGAYMPGETEKTFWTGKGSSIIWRLHKIHSETRVTYKYSYGTGSAPILYSTWEPYYENGARVGDVFYGFYGAHIFLQSEGWSANLSKESITFKEFLGERTYRGIAPYSFTRVTEALKAMHVAKLSAPNISEESVFQDDNKYFINNGNTPVHSVPLFRGIDAKIVNGGTGTTDDMISLRWRSLGGVTDVSKYCDYTVPQVQLPLYCSNTFDKYEGYDETNPHDYDYEASRVGPVPGTILELTWTDNPDYENPLSSATGRYSLIHPGELSIRHTWYLVQVEIDKCVYIKSNDAEQRTLEIDPNDSNKNRFTGFLATYSFSRAYAPAIYSWNTNSNSGIKYITNFEDGDRITESSPPSSLNSNFTYYNSLAFGGPSEAWVLPSSGDGGSYRWGWQHAALATRNWDLIGDPVDPC